MGLHYCMRDRIPHVLSSGMCCRHSMSATDHEVAEARIFALLRAHVNFWLPRRHILLDCSYFITEDEKQATYTGREQRHGVWILPFLVSGIFDRGRPIRTSKTQGCDASNDEQGRAEAKQLLEALCGGQEDAHIEPEPDEEAPPMPSKSKNPSRSKDMFDWDLYQAAFADTPLHAAISAMFAEYAMLVGRITRRVGAAAGKPMTLSEGVLLAQQARDFIMGYVTPILGHVRTTKIHRVLCHVLHSIKYHGNIMNANTSTNKQEHKADKRHYVRTNKRAGYTRQLVRHAHGTRAVLRRNAAAMQAQDIAMAESRARAADGGYAADDETGGSPMRRARTAHLPHERISQLATRPGLATLAAVLFVPERKRIAVPGHIFFEAQLPVGRKRQVLRASPAFFGREGYDYLEYRSPRSDADCTVRYGQVRLLLRDQDGEDFAVVAEMEPVVGADECPLSARGCTRLRWCFNAAPDDGDGSGCVDLCVVHVKDFLRVVHIVPDCADMGRRETIGITPPSLGRSGERLRDMRYLLNSFIPECGE